MDGHEVVIAGGGPTGLMLAGELKLAGVDVLVVERRTSQDLDGSRAGGLHARTIEVLDQRGIADRFIAEGQVMQIQSFAGAPLDIGDFPTRHPYGLALWQRDFERILAGWADELGVDIRRGCEVVGFVEDDGGIEVALSDSSTVRTGYLVGCDGGRSLVRKEAGIEFPGLDPSTSWIIAEVEMAEEPEVGVRPEGGGIGPVDHVGGGGPYRVVLKEAPDEDASEPTLEDLRRALGSAYGTDFGVHSPTWISRFTDASRQAATYRRGRVLLAGDAAHVHPPQGGQGLNTGVQDAVNLGWKLAQVVQGTSPETLLDTYHAERHPVGAQVLRNTSAQVALSSADDRHEALRQIVAEIVGMDAPRRYMAGLLSGLGIRYDLGGGHHLVGRRMPDLDLAPDVVATCGATRVYELLHHVQPLLLDLAATRCDRDLELPVIGAVPAPKAVLIRPDGHVAWAGEPTDPELARSRATWLGKASSLRRIAGERLA